jgi:hypothetical protein
MDPRRARPRRSAIFRFDVQLDQAAGDAGDKAVWIQIARTGLWKGYRTGKPVEFTALIFDVLIANFRAHPSFRAGPDGKGTADVIPFDFNHEMELDPHAVSAESWALDLETRAGETQTELWALARLLEPAKTFIKQGKLKWTSVSVWIDAVDPVSGEKIGPLLTSIAFTNQPFIEGMAPMSARIAASYGPGGYYDRARDAEDALCQLRGLLGLPQTMGVAEVMGEIGKLKAWVDSGLVPFGVDVDGLIGAMRTILGLPALSSPADVFAELDGLIGALVEQEALEAAESTADLPSPNPGATVGATGPMAAMTTRITTMDVLKTLSTAFGIKASTEDAVIEAAQAAVLARAQLSALFRAMGVADPDAAAVKLADLFAKAKLGELWGDRKLEDARRDLEELATLRVTVGKIEDEAAAEDVAAVMLDRGLPDEMRDILLESRRKDKAAFAARFPVTPPAQRHLTTTLFATDDGGQRGSTRTGAAGGHTTLATRDGAVDLRQYPGRNINEQAQSYIRATVAGADKWDFDRVWEAASDLVRSTRQHQQVRGN